MWRFTVKMSQELDGGDVDVVSTGSECSEEEGYSRHFALHTVVLCRDVVVELYRRC